MISWEFRWHLRLFHRRLSRTPALDLRAVLFRIDAAFARGPCRLGGATNCRRRCGFPDQFKQTVARILPVALLRAVALRRDDDDAVAREPPAGQPLEAHRHVIAQRRRAPRVKAQLHRGRKLVDVLAAGPGGADEALVEFFILDADIVGDADHCCPSWPGIARRKTGASALLSRPSMPSLRATYKDVGDRHKAGHDGGAGRPLTTDELAN